MPQLTPDILQGMECVPSRSLYETTSVTSHDVDKVSSVCGIDENKYSSLRKLLRVTVYCLTFVKRRVWLTLIQSRRESIERRCKLLSFVLNSLSLQVSTLIVMGVCCSEAKFVMLLSRIKNTV